MQYSSKQDQVSLYVDKFKRNFKNDKGWISLVEAVIIGLLIKIIAKDELFTPSGDQWAFILANACIWIGIFNSITSIVKEKEIVKHELRQGLSLDSYLLAHIKFQLMICATQALILTLILAIFFYANLANIFHILVLFISLLLTIFAADMLGLLISALVSSVEIAMLVMPFVLMVQLVLGGFIVLRNFILQLLCFFMISKNGLDAILSISGRVGDGRTGHVGSFGGDKYFQFGMYDEVLHYFWAWLLIILSIVVIVILTRKVLSKYSK